MVWVGLSSFVHLVWITVQKKFYLACAQTVKANWCQFSSLQEKCLLFGKLTIWHHNQIKLVFFLYKMCSINIGILLDIISNMAHRSSQIEKLPKKCSSSLRCRPAHYRFWQALEHFLLTKCPNWISSNQVGMEKFHFLDNYMNLLCKIMDSIGGCSSSVELKPNFQEVTGSNPIGLIFLYFFSFSFQ